MKKIIGYQIESNDGKHDIPDNMFSFEVYESKEEAHYQASVLNGAGPQVWKVVTVYEGDIEDPSFV